MDKKLKLFLGISYLLILFVFLYFLFLQIEISRLDDFSYYKELQVSIDSLVGNKLYINLLIFFVFSIVWVTLLGFATPLLIISGILFGKWIGTFVSVIAISIGASILYVIASFFFNDLIKKLLEKKFLKYINLFKKNEFCLGCFLHGGTTDIIDNVCTVYKSNNVDVPRICSSSTH